MRLDLTRLESRDTPAAVRTASFGAVAPPYSHFDSVGFVYDEQMNPASFNPSDDVSIVGPNGVIQPTGWSYQDIYLGGYYGTWTLFAVYFPKQAAPGTYSATVGPNVQTIAGLPADQDGDGVYGEPEDAYTVYGTVVP